MEDISKQKNLRKNIQEIDGDKVTMTNGKKRTLKKESDNKDVRSLEK